MRRWTPSCTRPGPASDPQAAAGRSECRPHRLGARPERRRRSRIGTASVMSWPDARWEHASQTTLRRDPVHPAFRTRGRPRRRSRAFVTTVALACLVVVFVAVAVIMSSLHQSTPATAGPRAASTSAVSSSSVSRLQAATDTAAAATTTARSGLDAITGIPTPAKVAAVINPYVSSLQRYEMTLAGTAVPDRRPDGCRRCSHPGEPGRAVPQHPQWAGAPAAGLVPRAVRQERDAAAGGPEQARRGAAHSDQLKRPAWPGPNSSQAARTRILGHRNP